MVKTIWNKIKYYVAAFGAGLATVVFFLLKSKDGGTVLPPNPFNGLEEDKENVINTVDEKLKDLDENGVGKKSDNQIVDYWRNQ
jgi:hypothetical protein